MGVNPPNPSHPANIFLVVTGKLTNYIIKLSEGKYRYFKCNFSERTNYTRNFEEKHVLLEERKLIFIESLSFHFLFLFFFFIWQKPDMPNVNFYLLTKKYFLCKLILPNTRQIKFVDLKNRSVQFRRKIFKIQGFSGYLDMLMMYINLPVHGHIQEFTKETVFCNYY